MGFTIYYMQTGSVIVFVHNGTLKVLDLNLKK